MDAIEGTFRYGDDDLREGVRHQRRWIANFLLVMGVVVGVAAAWLSTLRPVLLLCLGILAIAGAYDLWYVPRRIGWAFVRRFGGHDFRVHLDPEGFRMEAPGRSRGWHAWSEFEEFLETPNLLILKLSKDLAFYVPKRAFDPQGLAEARAIVGERVRRR